MPESKDELIKEKMAAIAKEKADIEKGTVWSTGWSDEDNREKLAELQKELAVLLAEKRGGEVSTTINNYNTDASQQNNSYSQEQLQDANAMHQ